MAAPLVDVPAKNLPQDLARYAIDELLVERRQSAETRQAIEILAACSRRRQESLTKDLSLEVPALAPCPFMPGTLLVLLWCLGFGIFLTASLAVLGFFKISSSPIFTKKCPLLSAPVHSCPLLSTPVTFISAATQFPKNPWYNGRMKVTSNTLRCNAGFPTCCIADCQSAGTHSTTTAIPARDPKLTKTDRF
jgi:hypothetical protein